MYIYICIFNIYCIVRSVPMRGTNTTRSDTETREAPPKKKRKRIFFQRRSYGERARARSCVSRIRLIESHTTFPRTSLYRRYIEIFSLLPLLETASTIVSTRVSALSIPRNFKFDSDFLRYLLGRLEPIANASRCSVYFRWECRSILRKIRSEDQIHSRPKV